MKRTCCFYVNYINVKVFVGKYQIMFLQSLCFDRRHTVTILSEFVNKENNKIYY